MANSEPPRTEDSRPDRGGRRTRGVVFTPAELEFEGVETVLDRMVEIGANAVALTPGVFLPGTKDDGVREPPIDVEGEDRILDRPLWGGRVAYVRRYSPYAPNPALWADVPFRAPVPPRRRTPATSRGRRSTAPGSAGSIPTSS